MWLLATLAGVFLLALGGWTVTHMDLLRCPWFRRSVPGRVALAVAAPAAGVFGVDVLFLARYGDLAPWAGVVACGLAAVGVALAIARPFRRPEPVPHEYEPVPAHRRR